MEDSEIVSLIYNRSEIGIEELRNKYNQLLLTLAVAILKNNSDSEESVADTYLKVWKTIPPYKPNFLKAFVCKLTRQISIDKYRANHRKNEKETSLNDIDYEIASKYSTDDEFYASELVNEINSFLEKLDIESQILFVRRYFLNETVKSLSDRFDINENKISVKLLRVKKKLKLYLERNGYSIEKN